MPPEAEKVGQGQKRVAAPEPCGATDPCCETLNAPLGRHSAPIPTNGPPERRNYLGSHRWRIADPPPPPSQCLAVNGGDRGEPQLGPQLL